MPRDTVREGGLILLSQRPYSKYFSGGGREWGKETALSGKAVGFLGCPLGWVPGGMLWCRSRRPEVMYVPGETGSNQDHCSEARVPMAGFAGGCHTGLDVHTVSRVLAVFQNPASYRRKGLDAWDIFIFLDGVKG